MLNHEKIYKTFQLSLIFAAVFLSLYLPSNVFAKDVLVICNKAISQDSLNQDDVKQIFLGRKTRWTDNQKIHFIVMKSGEASTTFLKQYVKKTPSQFKTFWKKMIFTGKGRAPKSLDTPQEMLSFIKETPGAIGYIPADAVHEDVKVISVN